MLDTQIILGFDVREPVLHRRDWTTDRRSQFLIRPDIESPLSVDRDVWPSLALNENEQYPLHLWGGVKQVLQKVNELAECETNPPIVIRIAVVPDQQSAQYWKDTFCGFLLREQNNGMEVTIQQLGYDVADRYFVSGLSNCMFSPEELGNLRRDWSNRINGFGLFSTLLTRQPSEVFATSLFRNMPRFACMKFRKSRLLFVHQSRNT